MTTKQERIIVYQMMEEFAELYKDSETHKQRHSVDRAAETFVRTAGENRNLYREYYREMKTK